MSDSIHVAVMTDEIVNALHPRSGGIYVDATLGGGTHTAALLEFSAPDGQVFSFDVDPFAITRAEKRWASTKRWTGIEANFRYLGDELNARGIRRVDGIVMDLGLSSDELEDPTRGISFRIDGTLDMRLGPSANDDGLTADTIVNRWNESELTNLLRTYGEEKFARRIAREIVLVRKQHSLHRTLELAELITRAVPRNYERGRIHPATRTFQALRIAVNDELGALKEGITRAIDLLAPSGVLAVISFHSLEDRIVKQAFRSSAEGIPLTKKPFVPSFDECASNPRARSAKLRVFQKQIDPQKTQIKTKYDAYRHRRVS